MPLMFYTVVRLSVMQGLQIIQNVLQNYGAQIQENYRKCQVDDIQGHKR
jgi:hypothetical protein